MLARGTVKTFNLGLQFIPTIIQVYLFTTNDLYYQIVNENLYIFLTKTLSGIPRLPNGDVLISDEAQKSAFDTSVNTYYNPE